jgi:hypothetical protein
MSKLFPPNINGTGRVIRGTIALVFVAAGIFLSDVHWGIRSGFIISGVFVGFEALRGWCFLRACGVKTKF